MRMAMIGAVLVVLTCPGCATHVSRSKQQQVELATKTGVYSYQRAIGPHGAPR